MRRKPKRDRRRLRKFEALLRSLKPVKVRPPGLDSLASDDASEDDRRWFETNPRAHWRLRPAIDGELPNRPRWVVSFQFSPGVRMRVPLDGTLDDATIRLMGEYGQFEPTAGTVLWIPSTPEAHNLIAAGRLKLPDRWIPLGGGRDRWTNPMTS